MCETLDRSVFLMRRRGRIIITTITTVNVHGLIATPERNGALLEVRTVPVVQESTARLLVGVVGDMTSISVKGENLRLILPMTSE